METKEAAIRMKTFFVSDTHFYHGKIIEYCNRPFNDVTEMNDVMIEHWNSTVSSADTVYHLGDFAFGKFFNIYSVLEQLAGKIILIKGNHDRSVGAMKRAGFVDVTKSLSLELDGVKLFLSHKPLIDAPYLKEQIDAADIHLCGHVHTRWKRHGKTINVGVDQWDFTPRTLDELLEAEESVEIEKGDDNAVQL